MKAEVGGRRYEKRNPASIEAGFLMSLEIG